ncbi:MAG: alpha/beta hydrolase, partial [Acidobacteriota bacterium]
RRDARVPLRDGVEIVHAWPNARLVRTRGLGHHRILRDEKVISRAVAFLTGRPPRRAVAPAARSRAPLAPLPAS